MSSRHPQLARGLALIAGLLGAAGPLCAQDTAANTVAATDFVSVSAPTLETAPTTDSSAGDGAWELRTGLLLGIDARAYGHGNAKHDGLETEVLAPILEARGPEGLRLWLEAELDGEDSRHNLAEAWLEAPLGERHWLRVGQQRFEQGSESATRPQHFPLVGVAFPAWLDGRTDIGLRLDGYADDDLWYALSLMGGAGFGRNGRHRRSEALSGRVVITPEPEAPGEFVGPFFGAGFTHAFDGDDPLELANPLEQTTFATPRLGGDSSTYVHLEGGWRGDHFRAGAETVRGQVTDVPLPGGGEDDMDQLGTWSAWFAVNLRGRTPPWWRGAYRSHTAPSDAERPIEFAVRYSNADIDRMLIDSGITNFARSTQEVRTFSAALSTWLADDTRLALQWTKTIADQELTTFGARNRDSSWSLRWDQRFGTAGR